MRKAQQFLQAKTEAEQKEIEDEFQLNFIDNFVEGESIFFYFRVKKALLEITKLSFVWTRNERMIIISNKS